MTSFLLALGCVPIAACSSDQNPESGTQPNSAEPMIALRHAWKLGQEESDSGAKSGKSLDEVRKRLETTIEAGELPPGIGYFVAAKIAIRRRDYNTAADRLLRSMHEPTMAPECIKELTLLLLTKAHPWIKDTYWRRMALRELDGAYGAIIPISGKNSEFVRFVLTKERRLSQCPSTDVQKWFKVAALFEELELWDEAWRAYIEATAVPIDWRRWNAKKRTWTWNGRDESVIWCHVAICAHKAGKEEIARRYLLKAAAFASDEIFEVTEQVSERWKGGEEVAYSDYAALTLQRPPEEKSLEGIVELYRELNAHPRAWMIIDRYADRFEDAVALRKRIEEDWLDVAKMYSYHAFAYAKVYGYEICPLGDPLVITIPWPFSKTTLECARARCMHLRRPKFE